MKFLVATLLLWSSLLTVGHAQEDADNRYLLIYQQLQQADGLMSSGQLPEALTAYESAQTQLQAFQQIYPNWDTDIVNYRLKNLSDKITALKAQLPPPAAGAGARPASSGPSATNTPAVSPEQNAAEQVWQQQLQSLKDENARLQAKLQEALSSQPQMVDTSALAKANDQIRELMKENALLHVSQSPKEPAVSPEKLARLQTQLEVSEKTDAEQQIRIEKLTEQNHGLQAALDNAGRTNADFFARLRDENQRLQARLDAMRAGQTSAQITASDAEVSKLKSAVAVALQEKASLEDMVKRMTGDMLLADKRFAASLSALTAQRNDLEKKLKASTPASAPPQVINLAARPAIKQIVHTNNPPPSAAQPVTDMEASIGAEPASTSPAGQSTNTNPAPAAVAEPVTSVKSSKSAAPAITAPTMNDETGEPQAATSPAPVPAPPATESPALQSAPVSSQPTNQPLPDGVADLLASAQQHFSNHEFGLAETDYQKILRMDSGNAAVLANLATIELDENKLDEADRHITAALARSPDDAYNLATRGKIEFARGKYAAALQDLKYSSELDANNPETENYLGLTLDRLGQIDAAEAALTKAIKLDPNYAPAHNNLAVIYMSSNPPWPQLARWHYQKALDAGQPRNPELEKLLAEKGAPVAAAH